MQASVATRPFLWDKIYTGIPPSPVTAVTVPDNRFALEGHELVIVEVGDTDSSDTSVLHVPDLGLVVAGDVIYNGVHMYLAQVGILGGFGPWRDAIDKVQALGAPAHRRRPPEQASSTTTPSARSPRPASTSTMPRSSCAPRTPPSTFSTPRSSATPTTSGGSSCGSGASVLYGIREHPDQDIPQIVLASWS